MPRPIHLTLLGVAADLQLVAAGALDVEEIVQPALALAQEHRQGADRVVRQAGHHVRREHLGFQRDGGLFFEREGDHDDGLLDFGLQDRDCPARVDAFHLHRVVVERHRVILLKQRPEEVLDLRVVGRLDDELAAFVARCRISPSSTTISPPLMT